MDYYSPSSNLADSLSSQSQLTDRFSYTPSKMSLPSPATAMHRSDTSTSHQAGPSSTGGPKQNAFNSNADNSSDSASLPQYHSYDDFDDFEEFEHDMSFHSFDDGDRNAPPNSTHSCSYQQPYFRESHAELTPTTDTATTHGQGHTQPYAISTFQEWFILCCTSEDCQ